jgi:hypothetical protein
MTAIRRAVWDGELRLLAREEPETPPDTGQSASDDRCAGFQRSAEECLCGGDTTIGTQEFTADERDYLSARRD